MEVHEVYRWPTGKYLNRGTTRRRYHEVHFIHPLAYVGFDLELSDKASCDLPFNLSTHNSQHHIKSE